VLITFEGIDGCGKTTQISLLEKRLTDSGYVVYVFREPGGTDLSEQIREILLDNSRQIHPLTELLLFSAARAQLTATKIRPLLESGAIVILDRYYDSTTAYQGYGRMAVPVETIDQLNALATGHMVPDITFYLDISPDLAQKRRMEAGEADRMEQSGDDFFERVKKGFDTMAVREERFVTLDASRSAEAIFEDIMASLNNKLPGL
jgi:dTMP kinase